MRVIVAGSRTADCMLELVSAIRKAGFVIDTVVSGTARGADRLGEQWAKANGVPIARYPADWDGLGKSAGYRRNEEMARNADALIALWDGESRGTIHMISIAKKAGLPVHVEYLL